MKGADGRMTVVDGPRDVVVVVVVAEEVKKGEREVKKRVNEKEEMEK